MLGWTFPVILVAFGSYFWLQLHNLKTHGQRVDFQVVRNVLSWGRGMTFSPEFEVMSGAFTGERATSDIGFSLPLHSKGSCVKGFYSPNTKKIESDRTFKIGYFACAVITAGSVAFLLWKIYGLAQ